MGEVVERGAKALAKRYGFADWEAEDCPQENLKQAAQACIEAIREPTEAMIGAASDAELLDARKCTVTDIYRAMIDEALK